jgi:hypothetical protein
MKNTRHHVTAAHWLGLYSLAALLLCASLTAHAEGSVYKWSDKDGAIHYTDKPPPSDGKLLAVETNMSGHNGVGLMDSSSASAPPVSMQSAPARTNQPRPAGAKAPSAEIKRQVEEDVQAAQADNCQIAKERYDRYIHSRHIYREGMDKTQTFLSDAEIDAARVNAKAEVEEACASR